MSLVLTFKSSRFRTRSSLIFRGFFWLYFGFHLGPYSIDLTQQKLEFGSDDSGCVRRTCVDAKLDFNFLDNLNFFSHTLNFFLSQLNFFLLN